MEDSVDGLLDELMYKQAFRTHPYRWPVIGWMKDIQAVTREKAVAFYRRYYAPNNAVLVIAGAIDETAALDLVAGAYGRLPAAPALSTDAPAPEQAPAGVVETSVVRPVPADRFVVGFASPGLGDPDRAAYEIANEILTGGPSSRLHRALIIDKEWASSVHGDIAPTRDPGLYAVWVQMTKGHEAREAFRWWWQRRPIWRRTRWPPTSSPRLQPGSRPPSGVTSAPATAAPMRWASSKSPPAISAGCSSADANTLA